VSREVAQMVGSQEVTLDAGVLSNLLELYVHDMSEIFPVEIGANGRFGYGNLPLYSSQPNTHFAFLIRIGDRLAGFALVTRGSIASADPNDLDMAEFFVIRSCRRAGVGRRAAFLLWNLLCGHWVVRVSETNRAGLAFWETTVRGYAGSDFSRGELLGDHHVFRVYTFKSTATATVAPAPG
jgi:predicted acetyltransferase